jgi:hypothetical protein
MGLIFDREDSDPATRTPAKFKTSSAPTTYCCRACSGQVALHPMQPTPMSSLPFLTKKKWYLFHGKWTVKLDANY